MRHPARGLIAFGGCALLAAACAKSDKPAQDSAATAAAAAAAPASAAPVATPPAAPAPLALADIAGKWNLRSVPASGDTTPTNAVLQGSADASSWKITFSNGLSVPARLTPAGDSIVTDIGPYASVRRKGVQVTTHGALRREGDKLVGTTVAHYTTKGPDSVLVLHSEATRAP